MGQRRAVPAANQDEISRAHGAWPDRRLAGDDRRRRPLHVLGLSGGRVAAEQRHPHRSPAALVPGRRPAALRRHRQGHARPRQSLRPHANPRRPRAVSPSMSMSHLFDLTGKTALVTGSSDGLGLAMARGLAAAGARIVLNGRDERKLATVAKSFEAEGRRTSARAFDVADEASVLAAFEHFDASGVEIDILVNNAGFQLRKPMLELKTDEWRRVVETHLTGSFQVGREAARRMIASGRGGKIINVASLASEVARATIAPYTAAKGGIKMLT